MTAPNPDFYQAIGLDRSAPPHALAARINELLATTPPGPDRTYLEQARAILGNLGRRQVYDRRLADRNAPPMTGQDLHELAIMPTGATPAAAPGGGATKTPGWQAPAAALTKVIGTGRQRLITLGAAAAALLLIIIVSAVSCSGDDSTSSSKLNGTSFSGSSSGSSSGKSREELQNWRGVNTNLEKAQWESNRSTAPNLVLHLTQATELPGEVGVVLSNPNLTGGYIDPYQNKDVGVAVSIDSKTRGYGSDYLVATFSPDGKLVSTKEYESKSDIPQRSDLAKNGSSGYFQINAADGVEIPAAAAGNEPDMNYALAIQPDPYDKETFWVLLRGGDKLYKADLRYSASYIETYGK